MDCGHRTRRAARPSAGRGAAGWAVECGVAGCGGEPRAAAGRAEQCWFQSRVKADAAEVNDDRQRGESWGGRAGGGKRRGRQCWLFTRFFRSLPSVQQCLVCNEAFVTPPSSPSLSAVAMPWQLETKIKRAEAQLASQMMKLQQSQSRLTAKRVEAEEFRERMVRAGEAGGRYGTGVAGHLGHLVCCPCTSTCPTVTYMCAVQSFLSPRLRV